ncbi:MAG: NPCBM/NEW2 domain-containing protein [Armatimonadetes bacterium]|nr:NPCBM/NEW2 domain-containing protein [Armatimonadota bacterium]
MKHLTLTLAALLGILLAGPLQAENERVCWLSDLDLTKVEQTWGFYIQKDKNYRSQPLSIAGKIYERGFQTVSGDGVDGTFELELKPGVQRFLASVGINDEPDFRGSVEFLVYGDTELLFSSGRINFGDAAKPVDVPLAGKKRLLLIVKNADNKGIVNGDWADARILLDSNTSGELVTTATPEPAEILTPKPGPSPKINGARVFGVRPGNPFFFKIPATGIAPITFAAKGLPKGLKVDPKTGVITGSISKVGEYKVTLTAKNAKGQATRPFKIVVGEKLALTPPMGWASYNCWGCVITDERMRAIADAFVKTDLINHGWTYMNIDDGWQARVEAGRAGEARKAPGFGLLPNERFPDMKGLCDYVHGLGLKIGIYSTPWKISYGGFTGGSGNDEKGTLDKQGDVVGKYTFEVQDAKQWAEWGFDSMKYDWRPIDVENTKRMSDALRNCGRDILFTLSNSADINQADKWAQLSQFWRTTGDITDRWWSMSRIGFSQDPWKKFAGPGHWNDPDMLVVGYVGWGKPRPTHLTPNEQYTHISLWCLQSAPLLLGCDLSQADDFTVSLLTNDEVLEVDQDPLGCAASRISYANGLEVWAKDMEDGSKVVGLFNTTFFPAKVTVKWSDLGLSGSKRVRDLWRQKDLGVVDGEFSATIPRHGVVLARIFTSKK